MRPRAKKKNIIIILLIYKNFAKKDKIKKLTRNIEMDDYMAPI
jgi:hypothetical protein